MKARETGLDAAQRTTATRSERDPVQATRGVASSWHSAQRAVIDCSPRVQAQRRTLQAAFGGAFQRQSDGLEDEEPLQAQIGEGEVSQPKADAADDEASRQERTQGATVQRKQIDGLDVCPSMGAQQEQVRGTFGAPNVQARPPTTSATIQRRPADWAGSADFVRMLGHAHGWFSTWKKIKAQIRAYSNLGDAQLDERRTALHTIRDLIAEWETDPKHTAASTEQRVLDIRADMPQLKAYVSREFTEVAIATDAITGGHAETRHGADLTDDQLIHRLTSGVDRAGAAAATDTSSRFATHELLLQTKTAAVNQLDAARTATIAHFTPHLNAFITDWNTFETTPAGPAKGVAGAARTAARQAVHNAAAIGVIPVPSPNMLRVDVNNPAYGGVAAAPGTLADIQGRVRGMLDTKNRYKIVINHGRNMGPSFAGTGPAGGLHPGGAVAPATQRTMTILQPGVVNLLIAPAAATWATITHYPCDPAEPVGISP